MGKSIANLFINFEVINCIFGKLQKYYNKNEIKLIVINIINKLV